MKKIKQWFVKNYDLNREEVTKYDYVTLGVGLGVVLAALQSSLLAIAVLLMLAHHSWKRK
ncbi:hypothetical protein CPT_Metamorpho_131 [Klebsiella phage Metamorpho]|nr:hypothetical protein CPT_Metamorpho_131 [Klebsiella phage Metamorpho]